MHSPPHSPAFSLLKDSCQTVTTRSDETFLLLYPLSYSLTERLAGLEPATYKPCSSICIRYQIFVFSVSGIQHRFLSPAHARRAPPPLRTMRGWGGLPVRVVRPRKERGPPSPQIRHRNQKPGLQQPHRTDRTSRDPLRQTHPPHRTDRRWLVTARAAHLRAQETP